MQLRQQTLKVANSSAELKHKLVQIQEVIKPLVLADLHTIRRVTGLPAFGYQDIVFVKRAVKEVVMGTDAENIQLLKCF